MRLGEFAIAAVIAGLRDEGGGLGGLASWRAASSLSKAAGTPMARRARSGARCISVLHLGEVGADALNQGRGLSNDPGPANGQAGCGPP